MSLLWLLAAHHLADVAFQPDWLIKLKSKRLFSIYEHVFIYTGVILAVASVLALPVYVWWWLWFGVGHFAIDTFFYRILPRLRNEEKQYWYVYPDQALHYSQILIYLAVI